MLLLQRSWTDILLYCCTFQNKVKNCNLGPVTEIFWGARLKKIIHNHSKSQQSLDCSWDLFVGKFFHCIGCRFHSIHVLTVVVGVVNLGVNCLSVCWSSNWVASNVFFILVKHKHEQKLTGKILFGNGSDCVLSKLTKPYR